jgi:uncharacterized protein (DUF362 family)
LTSTDTRNRLRTKVAVARLDDYRPDRLISAITRQLELLGGLGRFVRRQDSVLIKPNFIAPKPAHTAVQTDPAVVIALATVLKDFGARPFVADSPGWASVQSCARVLGLDEPLKKLGVPVRPLNKPTRQRIGSGFVSISRLALQADRIINLPKFKAHQQLTATIAVKNMFGCVCGKRKAFLHFSRGKSFDDFCRMLIDIYRLTAPVLSIVDGIVAMEGQGPINGRPRKLGFLVASPDPLACELLCCDIINLDPQQLPIVRTARQVGFGCTDLSQVEIVGDDYTPYRCTDFVAAELTPLQFSLPRVSRSICKQIIILLKSFMTSPGK